MFFDQLWVAMFDVDTTSAIVIAAVVGISTFFLMVGLDDFFAALLMVPPLGFGALAGNASIHFFDIAMWTGFGAYERYANVALASGFGVIVVFIIMSVMLVISRDLSARSVERTVRK